MHVNVSAMKLLLEYRIEYITIALLNIIFLFSTRIFYRVTPGFATDCPCGVLIVIFNFVFNHDLS